MTLFFNQSDSGFKVGCFNVNKQSHFATALNTGGQGCYFLGRTVSGKNYMLLFLPQRLKGVEELESLQQQLRSRQYMLKVINPDNKHIFLLDCARSRWSFSDINNPVRLLGKADPTPATALAELTAHLRSVPQQKARLILAVRPSAGNFAQALKEHLQTNFPELEIIYEPLIWENAGGFVL